MSNDYYGYSKVFDMTRKELRKHLREWEKENLPYKEKEGSVYDYLKEIKDI